MQEGQERDASAVEEAHVIDDDDDDEDSAADTPDLWMPERNEKDTKFVRPSTDAIPTKKHPQTASELSIVQQRKKLFKELVKGGLDTQTLSLADQYLRDNVRDFTWQQNVVKFPNGKVWEPHHKWLAAPDPREKCSQPGAARWPWYKSRPVGSPVAVAETGSAGNQTWHET